MRICTAAAILDYGPIMPLNQSWCSQTILIRIHGAIAEQTIKRFPLKSLMTGKITAIPVCKVFITMFHLTPLHMIASAPPVGDKIND